MLPAVSGSYKLVVKRVEDSGGFTSIISNSGQQYYRPPARLNGRQITVSENHPGWRSRKKGRFAGDVGGPFRTERKACEMEIIPHITVHAVAPFGVGAKVHADYAGIVLPIDPALAAVDYPASIESSDGFLRALGTTAISRVKPTNSVADVSTFLGETVKDGLPRLLGASLWQSETRRERKNSRKAARRRAGGEYLNLEFALKPFVSDILKILEAVRKADAVLSQYERDAGKVVRRRYVFPPTETYSETTVLSDTRAFLPVFNTAMVEPGPPQGKVVRVDKTTTQRWFSGAFTYALPLGYDSRFAMARYAARAERLFGVAITPEVIWNLAPWSWAADWFANTGDVISNLTDWGQDGLVLKYGYIMETTVSTRSYVYFGPSGYVGIPTPPPLNLTRVVKKRLAATPFGFGLTWEQFSARQMAIMAALGMSRK